MLPAPLCGIVPPLVTPLAGPDELDVGGLERLIHRLISGGVHGLFVLGSTGEAPGLSYRLRFELIERTCVQSAARVPVLVGITDTAVSESIGLARKAADAGADALVLATPYYFSLSQPELLEYLHHVAPQLPLPVFLYNMPSLTKAAFEPETVWEAARIPNVAGVKDSSGDMNYFHELILRFEERPDFALLMGPEQLMAEAVLMGAHGGVCGGANLWPELYVGLFEAASAGNLGRVRELQRNVMRIATMIYGVGRHGSSYLKGLKCALSLLGVCDDFMAEPFHRFREPERARVRDALVEIGIPAAL